MEKCNNTNSHNGTSTSEPVCRMVATENRANLTNIISYGLHKVARREMVGIFGIVKRRTKFDAGLSTCSLRSTVSAYASRGNKSFNPISRLKKGWNKQPLGVGITVVKVNEELEKFFSQ